MLDPQADLTHLWFEDLYVLWEVPARRNSRRWACWCGCQWCGGSVIRRMGWALVSGQAQRCSRLHGIRAMQRCCVKAKEARKAAGKQPRNRKPMKYERAAELEAA